MRRPLLVGIAIGLVTYHSVITIFQMSYLSKSDLKRPIDTLYKNDSDEATNRFLIKQEEIYRSRLDLLIKKCREMGLVNDNHSSITFVDDLMWDYHYKLVYCPVAKASSSLWKRNFELLEGNRIREIGWLLKQLTKHGQWIHSFCLCYFNRGISNVLGILRQPRNWPSTLSDQYSVPAIFY